MEAGDGERVAQFLHRPAQQRHRFLAQFEDGLAAAFDLLVERLGQIEQQHHRDVAAVGAVAHVDARIGLAAGLVVDERADGDIEVELAAFFLVADAHLVLRLQQVEHLLQALGQSGMFFQQLVDVRRLAFRMQAFVHAHPVRAIVLRGVVPFVIVAGRQRMQFDLPCSGACRDARTSRPRRSLRYRSTDAGCRRGSPPRYCRNTSWPTDRAGRACAR